MPVSMELARTPEKVRSATAETVRTSRQVQLRHETKLTSEEYVRQKGWESARLERCPVHPEGGCGIARHTPYARVEPPGMRVARSYCAKGHVTISLLPDCLASRLSSTLSRVEEVVEAVEQRDRSIEVVAERLRPEIEVQGAVRWVRRRVVAVAVALVALKGLRPDVLTCVSPTLSEVRSALGVGAVLPALREIAGAQVVYVPPYVGLGPRVSGGKTKRRGIQQGKGADPP
jgi:hypothetical protein